MKKINVLVFVVITLVLSACGTNQVVADEPQMRSVTDEPTLDPKSTASVECTDGTRVSIMSTTMIDNTKGDVWKANGHCDEQGAYFDMPQGIRLEIDISNQEVTSVHVSYLGADYYAQPLGEGRYTLFIEGFSMESRILTILVQ